MTAEPVQGVIPAPPEGSHPAVGLLASNPKPDNEASGGARAEELVPRRRPSRPAGSSGRRAPLSGAPGGAGGGQEPPAVAGLES